MSCDKLKKINNIVLFTEELQKTNCMEKEDLEDFLFQFNSLKKEVSIVRDIELSITYKEDLEELKEEYKEYAIVKVIDTLLRELAIKFTAIKKQQTPESRAASFKKPCEVENCNGFLYIDYHHKNPYLKCSSGIFEHKRKLTIKEKEYLQNG